MSTTTVTSPFHPETGERHAPSIPKEVLISHLRRAIELMNDGGRHWIQGSYVRPMGDGSNGYCALGAIEWATAFGGGRDEVKDALAFELLLTLGWEPEIVWFIDKVSCATKSYINPQPIIAFNDAEARTWTEVRSLFESTIERLEREDADDQG